MNTIRGERGQALVLIILGIVVLFGFVGLAVDGGRVFSEQRRAQNAADAAAYAAAIASVEEKDPYQAALSQAALNDYNDADERENADQPVDVIVNHPPTQGQHVGETSYYEVIVRTSVDGSFSRVLSINKLPVEVYAVVHATDEEKGLGENAIHGLDRDGVAIEFKGFADVEVDGGNIMSNGEIEKEGSSGVIHVEDGAIYYVDGDTDDWLGDVSPEPEKVDYPVFVDPVPTPDCGTVYRDAPKQSGGTLVYYPGIYNEVIYINAKDKLRFEPGLYCLKDGIYDNGNSTTFGRGVTFILLGGNIHFDGNSDITLTRPNDLKDASGNQWGGMLIYAPENYQGYEVDITGNNNTVFSGTIFAPKGLCRIGGNSEVLGVNANIVCYNILFHGNPKILIEFNAAQNFHLPPRISLEE